tara:strand:+ start:17 stop:628 length:612 start_codon:yes stop_codon:yes gene_type:complete
MAKFWEQKWFKTGVALVGADIAGEYLFGDTSPGGVSGEGASYFSGDNFAAKGLNYLGVTPFGDTAVGSAVKGFYDDYVPDWLQDNLSSDNIKQASASFLNMFGDTGQMPSLPRGKTQSSFARSNTNFQAGQAGQIPLGRSGRVGNALQSPKMQAYLAQHVRASKIPQRILAQVRSTGSTTLGRVSVKRTATRTPSYSKDARTG